jgi:hypothetical protein
MNERSQPACSTGNHGQAREIDTTTPHSEHSAKSSTVPTNRRLSAAGRLGVTRPFVAALACGAMLLGVSACGGSTPQVSQAVKSKLESTLERASLTAAKATEVTDCLVPGLAAHGITTLAAANHTSGSHWLRSATVACAKQAGLGSGDTGSAAVSSGSGVTDTEPADTTACSNLRQAFVTLRAHQSQTNAAALVAAATPNATMTQTLSNAFGTLGGDLGEALNGYRDPTSRAAEQAVASGCAAAGVKMPSGFTG